MPNMQPPDPKQQLHLLSLLPHNFVSVTENNLTNLTHSILKLSLVPNWHFVSPTDATAYSESQNNAKIQEEERLATSRDSNREASPRWKIPSSALSSSHPLISPPTSPKTKSRARNSTRECDEGGYFNVQCYMCSESSLGTDGDHSTGHKKEYFSKHARRYGLPSPLPSPASRTSVFSAAPISNLLKLSPVHQSRLQAFKPTTVNSQPQPYLSRQRLQMLLSRWLNDSAFMSAAHQQERENPFPGTSMNAGWNRARCELRLAAADEASEMPVLCGGAGMKLHIRSGLEGYSLSRQLGSMQLPTGGFGKGLFRRVFKGGVDWEEERGGWVRTPGSWGRKPGGLMGTERRSGIFIDEIEAQAEDIRYRVKTWKNIQKREFDTSKRLGGMRRSACPLAVWSESSLKRKYKCISSSTVASVEGDWILVHHDEEDTKDHAYRGSQHDITLKTMMSNNNIDRKGTKTDIHAREKRQLGRFAPIQVMPEPWRKRRRSQEKKAGRWTDGTTRMWKGWEEFYWVVDDERRSERGWRGLFGDEVTVVCGRDIWGYGC